MDSISHNRSSRDDLLIITVLTAPFLLNDLANIFVRDYRLWLAIDYLFVKAFPLAFIGYLIKTGKLSWAELGLKSIPILQFVAFTLAMTMVGISIDQLGSRILASVLPDTRLGGFPRITNPLVEQIDLSVGLAFVAVVEELIFRAVYFTVFKKYFSNDFRVFVASAVLFGLIHWSLGLTAIVHTALIGAMFMVSMWKTGCVLPTIIAHFFVNYVAFSGAP